MKALAVKTSLFYFFIFFASASVISAQDSSSMHDTMKMNHHNMHMIHMKHDSIQTMETDSTKNVNESIVREGVIDLKAIDKNKDGKVYQDVMDYNVISDKPGTCPLCGMKLKEVSIKKAKETLIKSGFKVKE